MLLPCPQPIGLNGCKKRETRNNHRPCGHVDEQRSVLLTRRMAVKIRLGTVALIVPRSRRPMAPAEVVPRSSTARPHRCPQGGDRPGGGSGNILVVGRHGPQPHPGAVGPRLPVGSPPLGRGPLCTLGVSRHRIVEAAALTPAFAGPYHRCFGAISAPDLCLPSTLTGLRESFP